MAKPQISKISPFDANTDTSVSILWHGNPSYANRVILYDSYDLSVVYDRTLSTMSLMHPIPAGTLTNGKTYLIQCSVFDSSGVQSALSDKTYFQTLETPVLLCSISNGETVTSSSCNMLVSYYQANSDALSCYQFALYDSGRNEIFTTDISYQTDNISYSFRGLSSGSRYYVRCYGLTESGMKADTGYVEILVNYGETGKYARLYAENDPDAGSINYHTNIHIILPEEDNYSFDNGTINLVGSTLHYRKGFLIEGDFTLKLSGTNLYRSGDILIPENQDGTFRITSYIYDDGSIRYKLIVPNAISSYILYSGPLFCSPDSLITLVLRRVNNIYELKAFA